MPSADIPEWVNFYVGIPYVAGGRTRSGVDCWGLINLVWSEQFEGELPEYEGPHWDSDTSFRKVVEAAQSYAMRFETVEKGRELLGDGILLRSAGFPLHVGMVVSPGFMLHILERGESSVTRYTTIQWRDRIIAFHRFNDGRTLSPR